MIKRQTNVSQNDIRDVFVTDLLFLRNYSRDLREI